MWFQSPLWFVVASLFVCAGAIVAAFVRMRESGQELARLGREIALKLKEHDDACTRLEGRVADLAERLARSSAQRREMARLNQELSAALEARPIGTHTAHAGIHAEEEEFAHALAQVQELIARTQEPPPPMFAFPETTGGTIEMELGILDEPKEGQGVADLNQTRQFPAEVTAPSTSARVDELESHLAKRDEELTERLAAIESLQNEVVAKDRQIESSNRRCVDLEDRIRNQAEQERERQRHEQALEVSRLAHMTELVTQTGARDEALRRSAAAIESLQSDVVAKDRQIESFSQRCVDLEAQIRSQAEQERERQRHEQALEASRLAHTTELVTQTTSRDEMLRRSAETIESLQQRNGDLEQSIQRQAEAEQERQAHDRAVEQALSVRANDLEAQLASRDEALCQRVATIEVLQGDVTSRVRQIEAVSQRCDELEEQLRRHATLEQEHQRYVQELENSSSTRTTELEELVAKRDEELQRRVATIASVQQRCAELEQNLRVLAEHERDGELHTQAMESSKSQLLEAADARCAELERQLRQHAVQEQERLLEEQERESAWAARTNELDRLIAIRNEELQRLQGECGHLTDRSAALANAVDLQTRDLRERERLCAEATARAEDLHAELRRGTEQAGANEALIGELADNRLAALFKRRPAQGSEVLPEPYLEGLERGEFDVALQGLMGEFEPLSSASATRLTGHWRADYDAWKQSPVDEEVVYLWADGIQVKAGLEPENASMLVIVGAFADGSRTVLAAESGDRTSKDAWLTMLRTLRRRGMNVPRLVIGDGALGLWTAIFELGWDCAQQYCWTHAIADLVAALPKKRQARAADVLRGISKAGTRAAAKKLRNKFVKLCGVRCASVGERLSADWKQLTNFYAFPTDHWAQVRTTAVVESPLAALSLIATEAKTYSRTPNADAILWKLLGAASRTQRKVHLPQLLPPISKPKRLKAKSAKPKRSAAKATARRRRRRAA